MRDLALVVAGSAVGGGLRWAIATRVAAWLPGRFPWGTLAVNVLGCLAMGLLVALAGGGGRSATTMRLLLGTGLLGGFTTYSAFNAEVLSLAQSGRTALAATYVLATLGTCAAAGLAGLAAGRALLA